MRSLRVLYLHNAGVLGAFNLLDLSFNLDLVYCTRCSPGVLILKIKYHTWLNLAALPIKSILLVYFWTVSTTAAVFFLIGPRKPCFEQFPYANLQFYQGPQTWTGRKHPRQAMRAMTQWPGSSFQWRSRQEHNKEALPFFLFFSPAMLWNMRYVFSHRVKLSMLSCIVSSSGIWGKTFSSNNPNCNAPHCAAACSQF